MVDVLTNRYSATRVGANLDERTLNVTNVNEQQFGKLFTRKVDGDVYAQPLVVTGVNIGGENRTVVYVATSNNSLYAYDAEDRRQTKPYWHLTRKKLGDPVPRGDVGGRPYRDFAASIGITSTPVIDTATNTIYFEAKSKESGRWVHRIHARDLATGKRKNSARIRASVRRKGGNGSAKIKFDPRGCLNRPGLLLMNGVLYLAFGSHGDHFGGDHEYHGWVLAYRADTLEQVGAFCSTSAGNQGGIWQSGAGLSGDDTYVYCVVGNGADAPGPDNFGNSVVKLQLDEAKKKLRAVAWFIPDDVGFLNDSDLDLSTGAVYWEEPSLLLAGGKSGDCYVLDPNNAGNTLPVRQIFQASTYSPFVTDEYTNGHYANIHGAPVLWDGPHGLTMYVWGEHDYLRAYRWHNSKFEFAERSGVHVPPGMPGGMLALSADGRMPRTGIVWAAHPYAQDANMATVDGILRAFDATDLGSELWNSRQRPEDKLGKFAKFCPPTVANGKVYMATFAAPEDMRARNRLVVYGLLDAPRERPPSGWLQADVGTPLVGHAHFDGNQWTITGYGWDIEGTLDEFHFVYQHRTGDFEIEAQVTSVLYTNEWAKAGVMVRQSLDTAAAQALMAMTPTVDHGAVFQSRVVNGTKQVTVNNHFRASLPGWVKLVRTGGLVTGCWRAPEDNQWTSMGTLMTTYADVLVGLAVTSHHTEAEDRVGCRAQFSSVTLPLSLSQ